MSIIEATHLCYTYPKSASPVLNDLSFEISPSTVTALLGCSGSGKSTLLLALAGLIPEFYGGDWSGSLRVGDVVVEAEEPHSSQVIEQVAIVFQVPDTQLIGFRVEETIAFALENQGIPPVQIRQRIQQALAELRITHLSDRLTDTLSGGQKQACVLAAMLALDTPVMVLDEPTAALDPAGKALVGQTIARLKQMGKTLIISDQNLDWFQHLADRALVLDPKRHLLFSGTLTDFLANEELMRGSGIPIPSLTALASELRQLPWVRLADARTWISQQLTHQPDFNKPQPPALELHETEIDCADITYTYPGTRKPAIANVSFVAKAGRILGIIGQNGSGKSTAIRHLNGLLKPQRGKVIVAGQAIAKKTVAQMARWVGIAFQNPDFMLFNETVEQEALFSLKQIQDDKQRSMRQTELLTLLEQFDLSQHLKRSPLALSVGEKQLLAILCALALDPAVLVLDEPTFGMDRHGREQLGQLLRQLQQQGKAIVCISHDLPMLIKFADDILVFQRGRVDCCLPTRDLLADQTRFERLGIPLPACVQLANEFLGFPCLTPSELAHCLVSAIA